MTHLAACIARQLPALADLRSDGELLAAFLADRDEAAFAEIVRRHGPLVWGACRRLLPDPADAEDAFQATFLVLVRRARRLTGRAALGPWLYRVAVWTARNVRRRNARTFARRAPLSPATADPAACPTAFDLRADLDGALLSLPEKYRTPLVLCHLQGWSRRDAAARLGCPEGTLSSLLSRGLARLRSKLGGNDPAKALVVSATLPAVMAAATVRAAAVTRFAAPAAITSSVSQLAEGVLRMFWVKKATAASFALVAVFGMGLGVGVSMQQIPGAAAGDGPGSPAATNQPGSDLRVRLDAVNEQSAATRKRIDALRATVQAAVQKLEVAKANNDLKAADAARAEIERAHKALEPALAKAAELDALRAALDEKLKAQPAPPKAAPPAAGPDKQPADLDQLAAMNRVELQKIEVQLEQLKAKQVLLQAEAEQLSLKRQELKLQTAELEKRRAEGANPTPLPNARLRPVLELTVGTKDAAWPYLVREHGRDRKPVGTVAFENVEVLGRFLSRTAKDPTGPREVRIVARPDTRADLFKSAVDACRAAGLKTLTADIKGVTDPRAPDKPRGYDADYLRQLEELYQLENELKKQAEDDTFKKWVDELNRQSKESQERKELAEKERQKQRADSDRRIEELNRLIEKMRKERDEKPKPAPPAKKP